MGAKVGGYYQRWAIGLVHEGQVQSDREKQATSACCVQLGLHFKQLDERILIAFVIEKH